MRRILLLFLLLALPTAVLAQDETTEPPPPLDITGVYAYEATEGGETFSGTQTFSGTGPVYLLTYEYQDDAGNTQKETVNALTQANYLISIIQGESCTIAYLVQQNDGTLFGSWLDSYVGPTALGIEYAAPAEASQGFEGTYELVGMYADMAQYRATLTISQNANGAYDVQYDYKSDENYPEGVPYTEVGVGIARDNFLGVAFSRDDEGTCSVYVVEFGDDGTYEANFLTTEGEVARETGIKQN